MATSYGTSASATQPVVIASLISPSPYHLELLLSHWVGHLSPLLAPRTAGTVRANRQPGIR